MLSLFCHTSNCRIHLCHRLSHNIFSESCPPSEDATVLSLFTALLLAFVSSSSSSHRWLWGSQLSSDGSVCVGLEPSSSVSALGRIASRQQLVLCTQLQAGV